MLYAVNTGGAAVGCFLTDFLLVPALGLLWHSVRRCVVQPGRGGRRVSRRANRPAETIRDGNTKRTAVAGVASGYSRTMSASPQP